MKLIHCADLHLDAPLTGVLPAALAVERKNELLLTFRRLLSYAEREHVRAILIAGDLFDGALVSLSACRMVIDAIAACPEVSVYYLRGNHDAGDVFHKFRQLPPNLYFFAEQQRSYRLGERTVLTGIELKKDSERAQLESLAINKEQLNIVMLHGQPGDYESKGSDIRINLKLLQGRGIDYLALGHVHSFREGRLNARGSWCMPGALEGRGFDECGARGFVLVELDEISGSISRRFVPFAGRSLHLCPVDVTDCESTFAMEQRCREALAQYPDADIVRIILKGALAPEAEKNLPLLQRLLQDEQYYLELRDETSLFLDPSTYACDATLKGEFIRRVLACRMPDQERDQIIACGLRVLAGEDVPL